MNLVDAQQARQILDIDWLAITSRQFYGKN